MGWARKQYKVRSTGVGGGGKGLERRGWTRELVIMERVEEGEEESRGEEKLGGGVE
jgi:hypothetical protein